MVLEVNCKLSEKYLIFLLILASTLLTMMPNQAYALSSQSSSGPRSSFKRVALITGSNKGIGKEIARKIGKEDDQTICLLGCRDEELGRAAVRELIDDGCPNVAFVHVDLSDISTIRQAAKTIEEEYGQCDILVNNAAVCFNDPTLYGKVSHTPFVQQADLTVRTNFFGTLSLTQSLLPLLRKSSSPRIINIASSAGRLAILPSQQRRDDFTSENLTLEQLEGYMEEFIRDVQDGTHQSKGWPNTCYGASKVAIIAMTKIMARSESNIMVNSVDPGYCATDQNNNQGYVPAERGATTPFLLATLPDDQFFTAVHWYEEQAIQW